MRGLGLPPSDRRILHQEALVGATSTPPAARQEETSSRGAWTPDEAAVPVCESLRGARRARLGDLCRSCVTMRQQGFRVFQVSVC